MPELLPQTLDGETANLQAIADELAHKPQLEAWATANPDIANHVGDIHKLYPWLPPGVTLALGTARYTPDDPFVQQLADRVMQFGRKASSQLGGNATSFLSSGDVQRQLDEQMGTQIGGATPSHHGGLLDEAVSGATGLVGKVAGAIGSGIPEPVRVATEAATRFGFGTAMGGLEALAAAGRNKVAWSGDATMNPETEGLLGSGLVARDTFGNRLDAHPNAPFLPQLTITNMINGKGSGEGFFPHGAATKASHEAQLQAATIGEVGKQPHAWTFGRGLAGSFFPLNSRAAGAISALGDAAVAWYADPAIYALKGIGAAREAGALRLPGASRAVAEPGTDWGPILDQFRQTIGIRTAQEQLDTRVGQGIIEKLTGMDDTRDIQHFLGGKVDPSISARLADTTNMTQTRAVMDDVLGTGIEKLPAFHPGLHEATLGHAYDDFGNQIDKGIPSAGYIVDRTTRNRRPLARFGVKEFPTDLSQFFTRHAAFDGMEAFLINARVPDAEIGPVLDEVARATNKNHMMAAFTHGMDATADTLVRDFGLTKQEARKLTTAWTMSREGQDTTQYFMRSTEDKHVIPGMMLGDQPMTLGGPVLPTEHLQNSIPFPDWREVRRAASNYRQFIRNLPGGQRVLHGVDLTTGVLDALQNTWKATILGRPALTVRLVGESQMAMAASGDASLFHHTLDWMAWMLGQKGATDVSDLEKGIDLVDYRPVFQSGVRNVPGFDPDRMWASQTTQLVRGNPGFIPAWAQEVRHAHIEQLTRELAAAMIGGDIPGARSVDEFKQAFFDGHLRQIRVGMMEPGAIDRGPAVAWRDPTMLGQRRVSDFVVDDLVDRIRAMARDDPEIMDAIANGNFRGEPLAALSKDGKQLVGSAKYAKPPASLAERLAELDQEGNAPPLMIGRLYGKARFGATSQMAGLKDRAVTRMFNMLVGVPMSILSASPEMRQQYYKEIDKLLPYMAPEEAEKVVERAARANIVGLDATKAVGHLDANLADTIAKSRALDTMASTLHDIGQRGQLADMLRFIFPFGDAFKLILTRWAKLVAQNPATLERFRQGMHEGTQSGFVRTDQYGHQVFTYPLSAGFDQLVTGLPFPMTAPLNGLSIVGSGLPGVGPAASTPLGLLAPHVPAAQTILDKIVPFGAPNVRQGLLEAFLPGWANRFRTAGILFGGAVGPSADEQSTFNHTVEDIVRYGFSTGQYKADTPDSLQAAVADARHKATLLYAVRGMMQFVAPSPPAPEYMLKDKSGRLTATYVLAKELKNLQQGKGVDGHGKNDPLQATQIFLRLHGDQNYLMLQNFTTPRRYGLPSTLAGAAWLRSHPGFAKKYPDIYGVLVPQSDINDPKAFDYSLYVNQINSGDRIDWKPDQFIRLANARIATMIYDNQRNQLPDDASAADKTNYLGQLRAWLTQHYPGYTDGDLQIPKKTIPQAIDQLAKAITDPAVRNTDAARGTRAYMQLRQQVIDFEKQNGSNVQTNTLSRSAVFEAQHEWLSQQASRLISEFPTFFPVWENLLSHEVTITPTPTTAGP